MIAGPGTGSYCGDPGALPVRTLHPFSDGNGRIGRLLIASSLVRDGVLREPVLVVSPWLKARRVQYQDGLLELSASGNWDAWVRFFAEGVAASADSTRAQIDDLLAWQAGALGAVRAAGIFGVAERVAAELIGSPIITAPSVGRRHDISAQGAMFALRRLASIGLVREERSGSRVAFRADGVLNLLRA